MKGRVCAPSSAPVYRYLYAHPRPPTVEAGVTPNLAGGVTRDANAAPPPAARGAVHSAEIEYALGNLPLNNVFAWSRTISRYWWHEYRDVHFIAPGG